LPDPENPQFGANILHVSLTMPELWLYVAAVGRNANATVDDTPSSTIHVINSRNIPAYRRSHRKASTCSSNDWLPT